MRVAHEAPLEIIKTVSASTDYDYALVHLFDEIPAYYNHFVDAKKQGRYIILDNSIFELGTAFNSDGFAAWVQQLKPNAYIVPDVLEEIEGTIKNFKEWKEKYNTLKGCKIGVVQGKTEQEIVDCYKFMAVEADIIAISFDYSWYEEIYPNEETKYHSWMKGRQHLIDLLIEEKAINYNKPHHLLGCGLPQEFAYYKDDKYSFIDTIDTSNPVVHGMAGIEYELKDGNFGLESKESVKLFELMEKRVDNLDKVFYNIMKFRANIDEEMDNVIQQLGQRAS
jgi:hypothetical protein|tara:strand:- start:878 stop:1717 length:840 start_codon:yes stop_codon:yes gene_type:complete